MKLYNTLTRQKEEFVPITPGEVKTVSYTHLDVYKRQYHSRSGTYYLD